MEIALQVYLKGSSEAVECYRQAFGAQLGYHQRNADGSYFHAELSLGERPLLAVSEFDNRGCALSMLRPKQYPTMNFAVTLDDEAAVGQAYEVLRKGGNVLLPLGELPWSACCANVIDRFGVFWYLTVPHRSIEEGAEGQYSK